MNIKIVCGTVAALIVLSGYGVTPANAAKRNVIKDANEICAGDVTGEGLESLAEACTLLEDTKGSAEIAGPCKAEFPDGIDNGVVVYKLRSCDRNEEALQRKVASSILSLRDFLIKGKDQNLTAGRYLCSYASKFVELEDAGKLVSTKDLALDAENIADDIGAPCL